MAKELGVRRIAIRQRQCGRRRQRLCQPGGARKLHILPPDTPDVNVRETALQGGKVWRCNGLIDDCGKFVHAGEEAMGWFNIATLREPYRVEGKKTMGIELAEQMGWDVPDVIFYPTGGGTGLIGMWKAFAELEAVGLIGSRRPRMVAVQAAGCAPIVRAWNAGADKAERWDNAATSAAGIRVPAALGDFLILRALRESDGFAIAVEEEAIFDARARIAREEGLLLCPEGAATVAGYLKALETGQVRADEQAVLFNCGNGLKYPMPDTIPDLDIAPPHDWTKLD
ncbi:threonine synthase [Parasphingopyxis algicola]|uniref:threonine synthase n=1 Tax=Parasphingopyxis algicola TaxID=2026624 RepID=UPI001FE75860|nr:threonine synthase [Parasphingopyxis algicola]